MGGSYSLIIPPASAMLAGHFEDNLPQVPMGLFSRRRATAFSRKRRDSDKPISAADERLEPRLNPHGPAAGERVDPDVSRMAQTFEALYSPSRGPTDDSAGWNENDNVFADMGHNLDFARAAGRAAFVEDDLSAPSRPEISAVRTDDAISPQKGKTTIEMAAERRLQTAATPRSTVAPSVSPRTDRTPFESASETPNARSEPWFGEWPGVQTAAATPTVPVPEVTASANSSAPDHANASGEDSSSAPAAVVPDWSSTQQRLSVRVLAGAAIALAFGTALGYMAGRGMEPTSAGSIPSFDSGLKLRLDSSLPQR
jgi:hypothetical protein